MITRLSRFVQSLSLLKLNNSVSCEDKTAEFEMKYTFHNSYTQNLINYLDMHYSLDNKYPFAKIQSIYLDDFQQSSYKEKINSDFLKTKYRVRWYEEVNNSELQQLSQDEKASYVFLEKKMKVGSQRNKERKKVYPIFFYDIKKKPLHYFCHNCWKQYFISWGVHKDLEPLVQISYVRRRYIEEYSRTRINLDYNITVEKSNELHLPKAEGVLLFEGVLEVKRDVLCPPESLVYVTRNMVRKSNFSKYERCLSVLKDGFF